MFDFTSMYAAENACRAKKIAASKTDCCSSCSCRSNDSTKQEHGKSLYLNQNKRKLENNDPAKNNSSHDTELTTKLSETSSDASSLLLVGLVGDSLLEPFWPTGSGCGRGFLSAMDSAWMVRQWAVRGCSKPDFVMDGMEDEEMMCPDDVVLSVLKERESIYRLLGQTKSENLSQNYAAYTLNPTTRYPNLNSSQTMLQPTNQYLHLLYDDIAPPPASTAETRQLNRKESLQAKRLRRATIASSSPFSGVDNVLIEKVAKEETIMETEETVHEEEVKPRGMDFLVSSMSSSRRRQKKESSPTCLPMSQVREDVATINQALEDSLADFESNYQTGLMTGSLDSKSLDFLSSSSSINNASNGSHSQKDTVNPLEKCRSAAFNDLMMSPSASNLATLERSRAKDIASALRHRRQQQLAYVRTDQKSSSLCEGIPSNEENTRSVNNGNIDEVRCKMSCFLQNGGHDDLANKSGVSEGRSSRKDMDKLPHFSSRVRHLESILNASPGRNSGLHTPPSECYFEDLSDQKKEIRSRGSNVMAAASNLENLLNPMTQEEKLKIKAKDYHKKTTDIKVVMKMTPQTDWNKKCWEEREKKAEGMCFPDSVPVKRVAPKIRYLIQKLSRDKYCDDNDESDADDEDSCSGFSDSKGRKNLESVRGHRAKKYYYTPKKFVVRKRSLTKELNRKVNLVEDDTETHIEDYQKYSLQSRLSSLYQRLLKCMMTVIKTFVLILLLLTFFCSFCYFSYQYATVDYLDDHDLFDDQDY